MIQPRFQAVADDVWCIDTEIYRPGLAACYLVRGGGRLAFIDTGASNSVPHLLAVLAALGHGPEDVDWVVPTHVHLDHAGGAGRLMEQCPRARLGIHPRGAPHMIDPSRLTAGATAVYGEEGLAAAFGAMVPIPPERVEVLEDGSEIDLGGRHLTFLDTPGHANHHGCIWDLRTRGCFTGDTFGIAYKELYGTAGPYLFAPTTPVAFDPDAWQLSLDRLMALDPQAIFLTHFGRLDRPAAMVDALRQSIRDQATLALEVASAGPLGRSDRLRAAIAEHLTAGARACGSTLDDGRIREVLAVDMDLNAQGLEVWLVRRERRSASASSAPGPAPG
jgi:glyoxylase-like metal-dependent hydrolase (beta-lactamase superfamily II)